MTRPGLGRATNLGEGTLGEDAVGCQSRPTRGTGWMGDVHEQARLSAGTVTDNDQFATDLRHLRDEVSIDTREGEGGEGGRWREARTVGWNGGQQWSCGVVEE